MEAGGSGGDAIESLRPKGCSKGYLWACREVLLSAKFKVSKPAGCVREDSRQRKICGIKDT
jgi:hypothetical protein